MAAPFNFSSPETVTSVYALSDGKERICWMMPLSREEEI